MALKFKIKSKDEVPAEHLSLYNERDGAWLAAATAFEDRMALT